MPDRRILQVRPDCLMFFVDETGHEDFADHQYPVFGMGGCAIMAGAIEEVLRTPWRSLKRDHFGGSDVRLHASELGAASASQIEVLAGFFRTQRFGRFAVTMNSSARLPDGTRPMNLIPSLLRRRWEVLASRCTVPPAEVALVHEASERGDALLEEHFGPSVVKIAGQEVPVHHAIIAKSAGDECMEVADFIVHAAGGQARRPGGPSSGLRKDFKAVFDVDPVLCSYIHLDEATAP